MISCLFWEEMQSWTCTDAYKRCHLSLCWVVGLHQTHRRAWHSIPSQCPLPSRPTNTKLILNKLWKDECNVVDWITKKPDQHACLLCLSPWRGVFIIYIYTHICITFQHGQDKISDTKTEGRLKYYILGRLLVEPMWYRSTKGQHRHYEHEAKDTFNYFWMEEELNFETWVSREIETSKSR